MIVIKYRLVYQSVGRSQAHRHNQLVIVVQYQRQGHSGGSIMLATGFIFHRHINTTVVSFVGHGRLGTHITT